MLCSRATKETCKPNVDHIYQLYQTCGKNALTRVTLAYVLDILNCFICKYLCRQFTKPVRVQPAIFI